MTASKPVVLYGTGDAAEKIIAELNKRDIAIAGIFASDGFVRSRSFCGYPVISYSDAKEQFGDMIVLLCFGSHLTNVIENIRLIASEQEMYAPDLPIAGGELFTREYADRHSKEIEEALSLFADDFSRDVFMKVINYKISGKIDYLFSAETDDDENWGILDISSNEKYMDLGAYNGDTVLQFLRLSGNRFDRIIAVEPEARNFRKLNENLSGIDGRIDLINKAVSDHEGFEVFTKNHGRGGAVGKGKGTETEISTVDRILDGDEISLLKMDLEGFEPYALAGAEQSIKKYKPKLLISAYHRSDDLWKLPKMIKSFNPDYRLYLRKSPCLPAWEINIYAK